MALKLAPGFYWVKLDGKWTIGRLQYWSDGVPGWLICDGALPREERALGAVGHCVMTDEQLGLYREDEGP
jgi:hypothetical protein